MVFRALFPPPPIPMTLTLAAKFLFSSNSIIFPSFFQIGIVEYWNTGMLGFSSTLFQPSIIPSFHDVLKEFSNPFPHSVGHLTEDIPLTHLKPTPPFISTSIKNQPYTGRIHRTRD